jgi:hypothetical protein
VVCRWWIESKQFRIEWREKPNPDTANQPICSGYHEARHANLGSHEGSRRIGGRNGTKIACPFANNVVRQQAVCDVSKFFEMSLSSFAHWLSDVICIQRPGVRHAGSTISSRANVRPVPSSPSLAALESLPRVFKRARPQYVRATKVTRHHLEYAYTAVKGRKQQEREQVRSRDVA